MAHEVNQKVYANFGKHGRIRLAKGVVKYVSPTGVAKVMFEGKADSISYMPNGAERGGGWDGSHLISEEVYNNLILKQAVQDKVNAVNVQIRKISGVGMTANGDNKADIIRMAEVIISLANKL